MKSLKYILTYILSLLILLISCQSICIAQDWNGKTLEMLNKSQGKDGGFSLLLDEKPISLYDTYYMLKTEELVSNDYNNNILKENLIKYYSSIDQMHNQIDLYDVYYLVNIYTTLGVPVSDKLKSDIMNQLMYYQNKDDGLFKFDENEDPLISIVNTELAVNIISNLKLKVDYGNLNNTIQGFYFSIPSKKLAFEDTYYYSLDNIQRNISEFSCYQKNNNIKQQLLLKGNTKLSRKPSSPLDLINCIAIYQTLKNNGYDINISSNMNQYLNSIKLNDGGFNLISTDNSDTQMTYKIYSMYTDKMNNKSINEFLRSNGKYRLSNGFYTFPTEICSNIRSSCMALAIINDLGGVVPNNLVTYLEDCKNITSIFDYYHLNRTKQISKINILANDSFDLDDITNSTCRESLYKLLIFTNEADLTNNQKKKIINYIFKYKNEDGGYGYEKSKSELECSYLAVNILRNIGYPDHTSKLSTWILNKQTHDGGFSDKSSSDLIDTYHAMQILINADIQYDNLTKIDQYLRSLKNSSGGFEFIQGSNQISIISTFYGCECEKMSRKLSNEIRKEYK